MASSRKLGIPYPDQYDTAWFSAFKSFVDALDANTFGLSDQSNTVVSGGGEITWSSGTLTWTSDVKFKSPAFGKTATVAAGSIAVADGEFVYASVSPGATADSALSFSTATAVPASISSVVFGYRDGTSFVLSTGIEIEDGVTYEVLSVTSGGLESFASIDALESAGLADDTTWVVVDVYGTGQDIYGTVTGGELVPNPRKRFGQLLSIHGANFERVVRIATLDTAPDPQEI